MIGDGDLYFINKLLANIPTIASYKQIIKGESLELLRSAFKTLPDKTHDHPSTSYNK